MSEIKKRLEDATTSCLKNYASWTDTKSSKTREELQESIHELRKVASRLEIDIAISERETMSEKPLAIPSHRSNSKHKGAVESILPDNGNTDTPTAPKKDAARRPRTRRPMPKKSAE